MMTDVDVTGVTYVGRQSAALGVITIEHQGGERETCEGTVFDATHIAEEHGLVPIPCPNPTSRWGQVRQ